MVNPDEEADRFRKRVEEALRSNQKAREFWQERRNERWREAWAKRVLEDRGVKPKTPSEIRQSMAWLAKHS
jgi:DNA/RNA-binding domain of Phe-tRNA-synthetase-like protein